MSSILSRIAAIGIIAGGFAVTGDLGKLAKRGLDVVNSRDVPTARPEESVSSPAETALAVLRGRRMIRSGPHRRHDRTGRKPRTGRNTAAAPPAWGIVAGTVCAIARPTP
jgi:hypothetical protein